MIRRLLFVAVAAALVLAACGDDSDADVTFTLDTAPETTAAPASTVPPETTTSTVAAPTDTAAAPAVVTGCEGLLTAFANEPVDASCEGEFLRVVDDGLADPDPTNPDTRMMVGITAWILRVPIPYDFQWRIPAEPLWLAETVEASPKGPIAMAVDGVPIFHYEARPDVSTHLEHYDPGSDTVVQGELDNCGGHSGQGDDYHYHYAPVCLLDDHDVAQPIAFGLDGALVFFGTGGTDRYGAGLYNDIDNLPEAALDECNALQLSDGSWVHYTTATPPYVIGCHHGFVDSSLQIEPRPMRQQGVASPYGGRVGEPTQTLVTDWYIDDAGWMHLEHESFDGPGTSAIVYRQAEGADCWEFDFRADADTAGVTETYCRNG